MRGRKTIVLFILFLFACSLCFGEIVEEEEVEELFSLHIYSISYSNRYLSQIHLLLYHTLPEIGVGIIGADTIQPPPWYAGPLFPGYIDYGYIPAYQDGGYDILSVRWSWGLDWDPTSLFDSPSLYPNGGNFYQFLNSTYDTALNQYLTTFDPILRTKYSHQLQEILYDALPAISIMYPGSIYGFKDGLVGIDNLLLLEANHRAEYWDDPSDHVIHYGIPTELSEYNVYVAESYYDKLWMQSVYGSLFKRAQDTHYYEPVIAQNATISDILDDRINITVFLDPDAKFCDGNAVQPSDVKYSYDLHMTPAVGSSYYGFLTNWFNSNDSISIVGDDVPGGELLFQLSSTYNFARKLLTFGIIDKDVVQQAIIDHGYGIFNEIPLTGDVQNALVKSCGSFKLASYDANDSIVTLIPNPYWNNLTIASGENPSLEELQYQFISGKDNAVAELIAGTIDILDSQYYPSPEDFVLEGITSINVTEPANMELAVNQMHPIFGTGELTPLGTEESARHIRKAISHIIPRQVIIDNLPDGFGELGVIPMPSACVGFDDSLLPHEFNITLAREYMEKAGYEIVIIVPTTSGYTIQALTIIALMSITSILLMKKKKRN